MERTHLKRCYTHCINAPWRHVTSVIKSQLFWNCSCQEIDNHFFLLKTAEFFIHIYRHHHVVGAMVILPYSEFWKYGIPNDHSWEDFGYPSEYRSSDGIIAVNDLQYEKIQSIFRSYFTIDLSSFFEISLSISVGFHRQPALILITKFSTN